MKSIHKNEKLSKNGDNAARELDEQILKILEKETPQNSAQLKKQFFTQLEKVSAEPVFINNSEDAAKHAARIIKEENIQKISVSADPFCGRIIHSLGGYTKTLEIIRPDETMDEKQRRSLVPECRLALVSASYAIADIGALVFPYADIHGTWPFFLAETVIAVIESGQILPNMFSFFNSAPQNFTRNMVMVAGPSRTADIEKILILGAHGPKRLIVFIRG